MSFWILPFAQRWKANTNLLDTLGHWPPFRACFRGEMELDGTTPVSRR